MKLKNHDLFIILKKCGIDEKNLFVHYKYHMYDRFSLKNELPNFTTIQLICSFTPKLKGANKIALIFYLFFFKLLHFIK